MTFHQEVSSEVTVGSHVACNGSHGTVKYIGSVAPFEGTWLGVEWDDPSRGKHDGSHNQVRYFQTRHPTSGSFVRPHKVCIGKSIIDAIIERYGAVEGDEMAGVSKVYLDLLKQELKARFVEVVGFDKVNKQQSHFENLKVVSVSNLRVDGAGLPGQLKKMCPGVTELDVSRSLLNSWETTAEIAGQLEHLENLTVSENVFTVPNNPEALRDHFKALKYIVAAKMGYEWQQILQCAIMWQKLEMLKVPKNNISKLEVPPSNVFTNLRVLDLDGNLIENWEEINKLGAISSLKDLNVCATGVGEIQFPGEVKTDLFPSLFRLNISENNIQEWGSISELNKLKSLEDLRIRNNPVLQLESVANTRQIIIARITSLKVLNNVSVSDERKGAEYDYLKKYALEWINFNGLAPSPDKESKIKCFLRTHPRFPELIAKYELPETSELKQMPQTILENVIYVLEKATGASYIFVSHSTESGKGLDKLSSLKVKGGFVSEHKSVRKTIHFHVFANPGAINFVSPNFPGQTYKKGLFPTTEVTVLQGLAKRFFKSRKTPKLSYISTKMPDYEHPVPLPTRTLYNYGIEDGDTVIAKW